MLDEFVTRRRSEIVSRARRSVEARVAPRPADPLLDTCMSLLVDQLAVALAQGRTGTEPRTDAEMSRAAARYGADLREAGFTATDIVRSYGEICQALMDLAVALDVPITPGEFKTLNRCLGEGIAQAVSEYGRWMDRPRPASPHRGYAAHEQRNLVHNAIVAFEVLNGSGGIQGATGRLLGRSLIALRDQIERSLADVRLEAGLLHRERVRLDELIEEAAMVTKVDAAARGLHLAVGFVRPEIAIEVDRPSIAAALANLLQNAVKFTGTNGRVALRTETTPAGRVLIEVEDECGGLPSGLAEKLFHPFAQGGADRSGLGLGLVIARDGVEANGGQLRTRDLPGRGCVFTIDLPRLPQPSDRRGHGRRRTATPAPAGRPSPSSPAQGK